MKEGSNETIGKEQVKCLKIQIDYDILGRGPSWIKATGCKVKGQAWEIARQSVWIKNCSLMVILTVLWERGDASGKVTV